MIKPGKVYLFKEKHSKMLLKKSKRDFKNHYYYIYEIINAEFNLYSDTSIFAIGRTLYQIQKDIPKLTLMVWRGTEGSFKPAPSVTIVLFVVTALPCQAGL